MKKILCILVCLLSFAFAKEERLVVLDPASIEIIYMLGAGENIKAIATLQHSHIYPVEKTSKLESVGSFSNPSVEKILALEPSLVILSSYSLALEPRLKQLGIKTLYLEASRLDDMYKNIETLAKYLNKVKEGQELIAKTKKELDDLRNNPLNKNAIFLFSSNPLMAFSDNSMIADILRLLGVENLTPKSDIQRPIISSEYILDKDPDLLIIGLQATDIKALVDQNPILRHTKAYKNKNLYVYEKVHTLLRISPNITNAIKDFKTMLENTTK